MAPSSRQRSTPSSEYKAIAGQNARAKHAKEAEDATMKDAGIPADKAESKALELQRKALEARRKTEYGRRWWWTVGFWTWMLCIHAAGILFFTSGFLLTRLVLDEKSSCAVPPVDLPSSWNGRGTVGGGCWHPKSFDRAVVVVIDALRYDFTVPVQDNAPFHNAFPFLHETAVRSPEHAVLRPFIADPPTTTLQRLKGLTTGTLPTFIDAGSNFAGTAIDEDNLLMRMKDAGKRIVHLGDDTWLSLFPGYFEANISHAYDSFNVWDLHTVDNGVIEHLAPLLEDRQKGSWDLLIGHLLGVDHAGHRYGPDHAAMTAKLQQMDEFIRDITSRIDEDTLLVVMGDHGMDSKGDHGGESDDEVEAALWMYSKRPFFGRTEPEHIQPPATAKIRPVNQIDLVPTLALLLGIPIPYNNLGGPIEEAFAGKQGNAWQNLAAVSRITAAGIRRYQGSYFAARGVESSAPNHKTDIWNTAEHSWGTKSWRDAYRSFREYQHDTLSVCKGLWARFDVPKMVTGITIMGVALVFLLVYSSRGEDDDFAAAEDSELDLVEKKLELRDFQSDSSPSYKTRHKSIVVAALVGAVPGAVAGATLSFLTGLDDLSYAGAAAALASVLAALASMLGAGKRVADILPTSVWGWLSVIFTVSQSVGFASNSYTIWEDSILLFFLTTFGVVSAVASFSIPSARDRTLGVYHSVVFIVLGRVASFSKLCREEQMPYCTSTYYASASSSTSAVWQLVIPFAVALMLPAVIKSFLVPPRSWEGLGPTWIGTIYRTGLFMAATYWVLDAADNSNWFPSLSSHALKSIGVYLAQLTLALAFVAGTTAFIWAPPLVSVFTAASPTGAKQLTILGYGNAHGARYLLLPLNILGACILLSKPMGGGALAIVFWQIMSLMEIVDLNSLSGEAIGPVMLGLIGNFGYFKTGHQAALSSIQWDSAFIPLFSIRYPWSPVVVALNTFAGQIIAVAALPLIALWKVGPKRKGVLESTSRALGALVSFFAVESMATMAWAGHLRRHLMLYRVFSPRFMMGAAVLLTVDLVGILVALTGVKANTLSVSEVFGWVD
ncbi:GPI ethanolamine phosphate transferase [Sodiomyces alkalinus F11]|uniref:GPI ethanolamine phosphate transferase n=1 Tax=Sodiomyces alkalinus (strain CBS 110278 / VKM F-3762 / F11) TaxID=1314773 RepID=A0A3N2PVZ6_SODAK|nr:GPI ethanolamine phosphate transferase [Sodiomyces alkalinus F11]ROT38526.1 GPI ethanolamine phosphate transferase [Sodiomyces alkalinus F11]